MSVLGSEHKIVPDCRPMFGRFGQDLGSSAHTLLARFFFPSEAMCGND